MSGGTDTGAPFAAWIAVASAEHVRRGRAGGFMQVCHGKAAPLRRIRPGDRVAYYSPTDRFGAADGLKAFTAIGTILPGEPYRFDMGGGFVPFRRDVAWWPAEETPIQPLLDRLELTAGVRNWGYPFRFGLLPVSLRDFGLIAEAMVAAQDNVAIRAESPSPPGERGRVLRRKVFAEVRGASYLGVRVRTNGGSS